MRILSALLVALLFLAIFSASTQFAACTKEVTVHDTLIHRDTITVVRTDTVTVVDSSCAACYDLKDGLIAYYNFNGGNLNDSSGNNNHITFNNAVKTTDRFGHADNAYLFDGTSSYMSVPNSNSLNPQHISIMAIIKVNGFYKGTCHGNAIVSKGSSDYASGFYTLRFNDINPNRCSEAVDTTKEVFNAGLESSGIMNDTPYIAAGEWINVIYAYDGLTSKIYVNGKLEKEQAQTEVNDGNTMNLFIGKHNDPLYPYWFNGVIDEVRIYNRDLCEGEVKALNQLKN